MPNRVKGLVLLASRYTNGRDFPNRVGNSSARVSSFWGKTCVAMGMGLFNPEILRQISVLLKNQES